MISHSVAERALYEAGPRLLTRGATLPHLALPELAPIIRGMWDHAGFIGPNNGGYPVVSLVAPRLLAADLSKVIEEITGRHSPERPLHGAFWVGVSGRTCAPWLRYLYDGASVYSRRKREQAQTLLESLP